MYVKTCIKDNNKEDTITFDYIQERSKNEFEFNLNDVITKIQEEIPQAGADGGGHEVAGSLKFVEGLEEEVLALFTQEVKNLKR